MSEYLGNKQIMARNITMYLAHLGKSRKQMCRELGFAYTTVCDWTKGRSYPRIDKIEAMAEYFHVGMADLVEPRRINQITGRPEPTIMEQAAPPILSQLLENPARAEVIKYILELDDDDLHIVGLLAKRLAAASDIRK